MRECAHVTASEKGGYELDICPEYGLSSQKYECAECHAKFSLSKLINTFCLDREYNCNRNY